MNILIDGYNLLWGLDLTAPIVKGNFELGRSLIIKMISVYADNSPKNIYLVLDGHKGACLYSRYTEHSENFKVIVTGNGITADDWIVQAVLYRNMKGVVVTSDREIIAQLRGKPVTIKKIEIFEKELTKILNREKELLLEIVAWKKQYSNIVKIRR